MGVCMFCFYQAPVYIYVTKSVWGIITEPLYIYLENQGFSPVRAIESHAAVVNLKQQQQYNVMLSKTFMHAM